VSDLFLSRSKLAWRSRDHQQLVRRTSRALCSKPEPALGRERNMGFLR